MADNQTSGVDILVTAPSDNEADRRSSSSSSDEEDDDYIYSDDGDHTLSDASEDDTSRSEAKPRAEDSEEKLCEEFANGATVSEEKPANPDEKAGAGKPGYEIVGDRVLVEKDGKFELVDANEIKAEYFDMLGLKPETEKDTVTPEAPTVQEIPAPRERPKTTPVRSNRGVGEQGRVATKRAQSSWGHRTRTNEYSHIRSPYGLTEKQREIKRRREEAIARRKKEEEEMRFEEERRRREDAEKAFQAWLNSKKEEEKERRKSASKDDADDGDERAAETAKAVKAWKMTKKKQEQQEQEESQRRMEETASMYVVHDREACEEAFKRWRRRKRAEQKAKELEKKKKQRPKSRRKPKEALPINSPKIRFTDNYGYRNAVVY